MNLTRACIAVLIFGVVTPVWADKTLTGEGVFYADSRHSLDDCKAGALQAARHNALADEYGLVVANTTLSNSSTKDGKENNYFQALSSTEVRGIWVADEQEPQYEISLGPDFMYVVKCKVRGKTRQLSNEAPEFTSTVLRNGDSERYSGTKFKSGDDLKMLFKSPVNGYLAVYLCCPDGNAYTLLPYSRDDDGMVPVKANKKYVIFSRYHDELGIPDEPSLTADDDVEFNRLYVIFSPNEFTKAVDSDSGSYVPRSLTFEQFNKWMSARMGRDPKMGLQIHDITIEK